MNKKTATSLGGSILLLLATFSSSQMLMAKEYYKWIDSQGSTHYSANPPPLSAKHKAKIDTYGYFTPSQKTSDNENSTTTQLAVQSNNPAATAISNNTTTNHPPAVPATPAVPTQSQ